MVALALLLPASASALERGTVEVDGVQRSFSRFVPPRDAGRVPLIVVALHGGGNRENGARMARAVGLDEEARRRRWIVLYPDARGGRFHAGRCCGIRPERADDVRFVERLVAHTRRRQRAARVPVVAAGFSNGGFLAYRLACETRLISAVAAVGSTEVVDRCRPRRAVSVLHIHARDDDRVRFGGGGLLSDEIPGVLELMQRWRARNRCGTPVVTRTPALTRSVAAGCRGGATVELLAPASGGHGWPGAGAPYGPASDAVDATTEIARFLTRSR